jgi:hypothetical protein
MRADARRADARGRIVADVRHSNLEDPPASQFDSSVYQGEPIGAVAAVALARVLASTLYGVAPNDPGVIMITAAVMTVPNADRAIIAAGKLTTYLLNVSHKRGAAKARLLLSVGYRSDAPQALESDLRTQHLALNATRTSENTYGVVYEIEGPIKTPSGKIVRFCSIWQIDTGTEVPRFITMFPR